MTEKKTEGEVKPSKKSQKSLSPNPHDSLTHPGPKIPFTRLMDEAGLDASISPAQAVDYLENLALPVQIIKGESQYWVPVSCAQTTKAALGIFAEIQQSSCQMTAEGIARLSKGKGKNPAEEDDELEEDDDSEVVDEEEEEEDGDLEEDEDDRD